MAKLELVSFKLCPFVQRSTITLQEKGVPYDIRYIELSDKPDWFLAISPLGKVPVLRIGEVVLFESAVINEYIDETTEGPRLLPADPLERAYHRAWIEFASNLIMDAHRLLMSHTESDARTAAQAAHHKLGRLQEQLTGPLFSGEQLTLMDAAAAPVLQRLRWVDAVAPELELFAGLDGVVRWRDALLSRESVARSTVPEIHELWLSAVRSRRKPGPRGPATWLAQREAATD